MKTERDMGGCKMPSLTRVEIANSASSTNRKSVICLCCKDEIEPKQHEAGKAFCWLCEQSIFGNDEVENPSPFLKKALSMKQIEAEHRKKEEEQFLKMMKGLYRRLQLMRWQ